MDKKTQMYLGVAILAVAGYMIWKNMKDKKDAQAKAAAPAPAAPAASFSGSDMNTVVGKRVKMVGLVGANKDVMDSGWVRADGSSIAPTFFDVQNSKWIGR